MADAWRTPQRRRQRGGTPPSSPHRRHHRAWFTVDPSPVPVAPVGDEAWAVTAPTMTSFKRLVDTACPILTRCKQRCRASKLDGSAAALLDLAGLLRSNAFPDISVHALDRLCRQLLDGESCPAMARPGSPPAAAPFQQPASPPPPPPSQGHIVDSDDGNGLAQEFSSRLRGPTATATATATATVPGTTSSSTTTTTAAATVSATGAPVSSGHDTEGPFHARAAPTPQAAQLQPPTTTDSGWVVDDDDHRGWHDVDTMYTDPDFKAGCLAFTQFFKERTREIRLAFVCGYRDALTAVLAWAMQHQTPSRTVSTRQVKLVCQEQRSRVLGQRHSCKSGAGTPTSMAASPAATTVPPPPSSTSTASNCTDVASGNERGVGGLRDMSQLAALGPIFAALEARHNLEAFVPPVVHFPGTEARVAARKRQSEDTRNSPASDKRGRR